MKNLKKLPNDINNPEIVPYYKELKKKHCFRFIKRTFDIFVALILILILFIPSLIIGLLVVLDSKGGMFFLQKRVGRYGKPFTIVKFRTMKSIPNNNQLITSSNDKRITKIGLFLRRTHIDEFPQLLNVLVGQMSFVGTRPEVEYFVDKYKNEWKATLLMRPGITSTASYSCDDEAKFMTTENYEEVYLNKILPHKMELNLNDLKKASLRSEIKILWKTVF